jgi:hypothetical protein
MALHGRRIPLSEVRLEIGENGNSQTAERFFDCVAGRVGEG